MEARTGVATCSLPVLAGHLPGAPWLSLTSPLCWELSFTSGTLSQRPQDVLLGVCGVLWPLWWGHPHSSARSRAAHLPSGGQGRNLHLLGQKCPSKRCCPRGKGQRRQPGSDTPPDLPLTRSRAQGQAQHESQTEVILSTARAVMMALQMTSVASANLGLCFFRMEPWSPGWVVQWSEPLPRYVKVVGSIPGQGTYKNQPMNASVSGTTNQCFSPSLSFSAFLPLSKITENPGEVCQCHSLGRDLVNGQTGPQLHHLLYHRKGRLPRMPMR